MKKIILYTIIGLILIILGCAFYWYELRPYFGRKECYKRAEMWRQTAITADDTASEHGFLTKQADYEKIFKDDYAVCLMQKGLK